MFALALALLSPRALACGPDFADRLLDDRVASVLEPPDAAFLAEAHALSPKPSEPLFVRENACWVEADCRAQRLEIEAAGLTSDQAALVTRMREAPSAEEAYALGEGLPEDVRLYTAGAVAYRSDPAASGRWFLRVLERPPEQAKIRGAWAAYMAARLSLRSYSDVRARVAAGALDPLGLAASSLGEEARLRWDLREAPGRRWSEEVSAAVALYAEQAAHGSDSGALSLLFLARSLPRDARSVELAERDPLVRRLLVLFLWTRPHEIPSEGPSKTFPEALVDMLQRIELPEEGIDQVAAAAYRRGLYDLAARAAARADSPIAALVRAKLALRAGDLDAAASEYKRAIPALSRESLSYGGKSPHTVATGEAAVVALARGDYLSALDTLYQASLAASAPQDIEGLWFDAAYIAERVLTTDELAHYVDSNVPKPASWPDEPLSRWGFYGGEYKASHALRWLLARRLMRENQPARAIPYFDRPLDQAKAVAYAAAYAKTTDRDPVTQASAWLSLSRLTRPGIHLLGTEDLPDYHELFGDYDLRQGPDGAPSLDDFALPEQLAGPDERERLAKSRPASLARFHYRDLSVDYAMRAASLLPQRSAAYAAVLWEAAERSSHNPARRDAIMRQYYETAPLFYSDGREPDWQGAREHLAGTWLPPHEREKREKRKKIIASASLLAASGALLLGIALRASRARR